MIRRKLVDFPKSSLFLFGPRQTGKTSLIQAHLKNQKKSVWHVNLLLNKNYLLYEKDPSRFTRDAIYQIERKMIKYIFVDEVQKIPLLLDEIHQLIETYKQVHFFLSGSSARKLKKGSANLLGGRALLRYLFPLTRFELGPKFSLERALSLGTLPGIYFLPEDLALDHLRAYTETYLKEEILAEGLVRNIGSFHRFLEVAAQHMTETINYENIARESATKGKVVKGYFDILVDTLVGYILPAWDLSIRKQLALHPKFYFFDNGVVSGIHGSAEAIRFPDLRGKLFEQWFINEVRAIISYTRAPIKMNFWRTQAGNEVDLILSRNNKPIVAIEIKAMREIGKKHLSGLKSFREEYPDTKALFICETQTPQTVDEIDILPMSEFFDSRLMRILGQG